VPTTRTWLPAILVANLVAEVVIVVTGGLVRLTGSGLGCPTWPQCVPGSYVPVPHQEQGFHKFIEFGNRTLTGMVGIAALLVVYAVWRWSGPARDRWYAVWRWEGVRADLARPAWVVLGGVVVQAVLGGITVRTGLNPATVAAHFLVSMVLVAASAYMVFRAPEPPGPRPAAVPRLVERLALLTSALGAVVLVLGTLVTGSGPHSGDADEPARLALDPRTISWLHADAVMLFVGLVVAVWLAARLTARSAVVPRAWRLVLVVTLAQGVIGYTQYFTGLPWMVVLLHMAGAAALVVALTNGMVRLRTTRLEVLPRTR
jgi:cytochrome c oxidase assembly protein subunit 15